jgi:hypothetical protein
MLETILIITLSVLFLIFFRPGKTPPLDNPLVIERPGQYKITMAPQLNLAQPFIEAIARQVGTRHDPGQTSETQCFEVIDRQVKAHGRNSYLLCITLRNGLLYFQAINPGHEFPIGKMDAIQKDTATVLADIPNDGMHNLAQDFRLVAAVQKASLACGVKVVQLPK